MQPQGDAKSLINPTGQHRVSFFDIGKLVTALIGGIAGAVFLTQNYMGVLEVRNRLQCGQTIQEVSNDHYKEHPAIYYLLSPARAIGGSISQQNPHRDERCFRNGQYFGLFPYSPASKS